MPMILDDWVIRSGCTLWRIYFLFFHIKGHDHSRHSPPQNSIGWYLFYRLLFTPPADVIFHKMLYQHHAQMHAPAFNKYNSHRHVPRHQPGFLAASQQFQPALDAAKWNVQTRTCIQTCQYFAKCHLLLHFDIVILQEFWRELTAETFLSLRLNVWRKFYACIW